MIMRYDFKYCVTALSDFNKTCLHLYIHVHACFPFCLLFASTAVSNVLIALFHACPVYLEILYLLQSTNDLHLRPNVFYCVFVIAIIFRPLDHNFEIICANAVSRVCVRACYVSYIDLK